MFDERASKTQGKNRTVFRIHRIERSIFLFQLYKSYEHAQNEVEKLRQEIYPNLYDETSDASKLETITEDTTDLTDTNNDFTEDTSEAHGSGSDDEVRGRNLDDGDENNSGSDNEGDGEQVSNDCRIHIWFSLKH